MKLKMMYLIATIMLLFSGLTGGQIVESKVINIMDRLDAMPIREAFVEYVILHVHMNGFNDKIYKISRDFFNTSATALFEYRPDFAGVICNDENNPVELIESKDFVAALLIKNATGKNNSYHVSFLDLMANKTK